MCYRIIRFCVDFSHDFISLLLHRLRETYAVARGSLQRRHGNLRTASRKWRTSERKGLQMDNTVASCVQQQLARHGRSPAVLSRRHQRQRQVVADSATRRRSKRRLQLRRTAVGPCAQRERDRSSGQNSPPSRRHQRSHANLRTSRHQRLHGERLRQKGCQTSALCCTNGPHRNCGDPHQIRGGRQRQRQEFVYASARYCGGRQNISSFREFRQ